jgi:signal transduction histidine kinase
MRADATLGRTSFSTAVTAARARRRSRIAVRRLAASGVGIAAALTVIPVKMALNDSVGRDVGFIPAITAVLVAAWLGGFLPGLLATLTGVVVETTFFMEPPGSNAPVAEPDRIRLGMFILLGIVASLLAWLRVRAEERAEVATDAMQQSRSIADLRARRLDNLQALTTDLADAVTTEDIAKVVLARGIAALRAHHGAVYLIDVGDGVGPEPTRAGALLAGEHTVGVDGRATVVAAAGGTAGTAPGAIAGTAPDAIAGTGADATADRPATAAADHGAAASAEAAIDPGAPRDAPADVARPLARPGAVVAGVTPGPSIGLTLRVVAQSGQVGHPPAVDALPLDTPLPAPEVARTGVAVFIEDPQAYVARYGRELTRRGLPARPRAIAVVPLAVEGRRFGVLEFSWSDTLELPRDRQAFMAAIGRLAAGAIERGRLFDAEREALLRARASEQRVDVLAQAGRILAMSLDYDVTLRRLAGLALPLMGDLCIVDAVEPGRPVRRLVAASDPALAEAVRSIEARPDGSDVLALLTGLLEDGRPTVLPVDEATLAAVAGSAEHAAALAAVGARWALVIPMRLWERTIGAIAFLRREDRAYDRDEITVGEELGDRAGRALENARLHGEVARLADREARHAAELEAVLGSLGEGILVVGPDGTVRSSNAAFRRLVGDDLTTIDDLMAHLQSPDGGQPVTLEGGPFEYRLAGRPAAWIEVTAYPVAEPTRVTDATQVEIPSRVIVCRDVTAFRQGQALREAFLGLLSHELRTPVTTIYGGSAVLAKPGSTLPPEVAGEILADIAGEADRLYRLVEDLLVLARFDEGIDLGEEPALLQHLVPAVVAQERSRWPTVRFEVRVEPDLPAVSGDETSITQVVRNLLSNAAKYSFADAVVSVVVERLEDGVVVRVRDTGPGIEPEEADAIFNPFFRSPSTARMAGGAGIGLYVSRRLVDAMNGRIWAEPRREGGSEFSFVLPPYASDLDE